MLEFNKIEEMREYYNEETDVYEFKKDGEGLDVKFNFDLNINYAMILAGNVVARHVKCGTIIAHDIVAHNIQTVFNIEANNIKANNINAKNIKSRDIRANDIKANNINARNIYASDIVVNNIIADNIEYWAYCIARESFYCTSVKGRRDNSVHRCLDEKIKYIKEEKLTEEEVIEQLEELLKKEDRQALKRAVELLKQSNKVKLELKSFKDDIVEKQEKNKEHRLLISLKRL